MFKPEMSVITYTMRDGGLDWTAKLLAKQTFNKFEWIVVDAFYDERHQALKTLCNNLGIHLIHLPEPTLPYKITGYNIASNGNAAFAHINSENVVILDDWHIFPENLLERHKIYLDKNYASIPVWHHVESIVPDGILSYNELVPLLKITNRDHRLRPGMNSPVIVPDTYWWPNATAVPAKCLFMVEGYDERLNGGTGGTDLDIAYRMSLIGLKYLYIPDMVVYHISSSGLRTKERISCQNSHDRNPFTKNQYYDGGDNTLLENHEFKCIIEDGVRFYTCKSCGAHGCIDSTEVLNSNRRARRIVPPIHAAGFKRATLLNDVKTLIGSGYSHKTKCVVCSEEE